jgi:peptidyl-prolyl cis-trans isomerase SurA
MNKLSVRFILLLVLIPTSVFCQQQNTVDKIIAIVGASEILQSDIEKQYLQAIAQRQQIEKCEIFENLLVQKLLVNQAKVDSIEVSDGQVDMQLENRMKYFIEQAGSKEKLEEYFKKSLMQIKEDFSSPLKEQMITQKMQGEITNSVKITPTEVNDFYTGLSKDSIPMINAQIEYQQICVYPPYAQQSIFDIKQKLLGLRKRVLEGEKFSTLALLYSEDPGSSKAGGEIGFMSKGGLDPEYAKTAWSLKENNVSNIVESEYGFHIIQLIARDGDKVNTRHILLKPKATDKEIIAAMGKMDSIMTVIKKDTMPFNIAANFFSEDKNSKLNGGVVVNPQTNSTKFELDQLTQEDYYIIKSMNVGDVSAPFPSKDENKKDVFKVIKLVSKLGAHKANLKDDYQLIQEIALEHKKQLVIKEWIAQKQKSTYIRIDDSMNGCMVSKNGWIQTAK